MNDGRSKLRGIKPIEIKILWVNEIMERFAEASYTDRNKQLHIL